MTTALYRKYRPQWFADIVGQDHVTKTLQQEIALGKLVHAYLFCGMRGIGKTTMARLLAKALNCQKRQPGESEPCGTCTSCLAIRDNQSLDLLEIDAASNRRIDDIREIKQQIPYGPISSPYKIVIIDEAHMLTAEAFNALLKTLEEPPSHTIFVLATTEVHKLPETIISRCQRFDFHKVATKELVPRLAKITKAEGIEVATKVLEQIARLSGGSSRDAESLLGKLLSLGDKKITEREASLVLPRSDIEVALTLVQAMVERATATGITKLNNFFFDGGDLGYLHQQVTELLRKLLLIKLGGSLPELAADDLSPAQESVIQALAKQVTHWRVQAMLEQWLEAPDFGRQSEIAQLSMELALVAICERNNNSAAVAASVIESGTASQTNPAPASNVAPKVKVSTDDALPLAKVQSSWPALIDKLKEYNHSLSLILSVAEPVKVVGNSVEVAFAYSLHLERVNNAKVRAVIEQALQEILGLPLVFKGIVKQAGAAVQDDLLANVLSTFGGRVE